MPDDAKTTAQVCDEREIPAHRITDLIRRRKLKPPRKFGSQFVWTPKDEAALDLALERAK